jgi:hypothetical protein
LLRSAGPFFFRNQLFTVLRPANHPEREIVTQFTAADLPKLFDLPIVSHASGAPEELACARATTV